MTAAAVRPRAAHARPGIPGPPGHPLLGMARALRGDLLGTLQDGFRRYGDVVAYPIGPAQLPRRLRRAVVAVHHPDELRRVFVETGTFTRRTPSYGVLRELFGENLVTAEGAGWERQKRMLQPLLTRRRVAQYAALIEAEAEAVVAAWQVDPDRPVDAAKAMEAYALRVLGRTLFGDARRIDDDTVTALERLVPVVGTRVSGRVRQPVRLPLRVPTTGNRAFVELREELHATVERVLARRGAAGDGELVSRLREARDPEGGMPLSPRELREEALMFLIAGHTTTSNALTATLHLLGRDARVQEQVAEAARADAPPQGPEGQDLVRAAVQEAMRLQPPSYVLARRVAGDAELGGHALRAGTLVLISPWVTHRHPRVWRDPEGYDPTRFLGRPAHPQFAYLPFGGGTRSCIGRHLALLEATILVRALLRRCRLEAVADEIPRSQLISIRPDGPVLIRCRPRRPVAA